MEIFPLTSTALGNHTACRQARRRKLVVEQQAAAASAERKSQVEALVTALQRQSAEEQRLAARLWQASLQLSMPGRTGRPASE